MQRRDVLIGAGSISAGILGSTIAFTDESEATDISVDSLDIPNESIQTNNPVSGLYLSLDGSYTWDTTTVPTRAVLRVNVTRTETEQLAAESLDTLEASVDSEYRFSDVNVLDHSQITATELSPTEVGETRSYELTISVKLEVFKDGSVIGEKIAQTDVTIDVEKTEAQVEASLSGQGSIEVLTSTP